MNKNIVLLLILINTCSYSQESEQYLKFKSDPEYQEAYILTLDSIKIKGLLKPKTMSEQLSVLNFVHPDGTRKKYHPADIKGYGYSVFNFISIDDTFFRIIMTGKKVNLYKEVIPARTVATTPMPGAAMGGTGYSDEKINFYVRKPGEKGYTKVSKKKFKDNFSEYFAECEKLKIKILNGELTYKDIESIVRQYNYCY